MSAEIRADGVITLWDLQPMRHDRLCEVLVDKGLSSFCPNPPTDMAAVKGGIKAVYGGKDKLLVNRKNSRTDGVELVHVEKGHSNAYVPSFGAKAVADDLGMLSVQVDGGYASEYRLTEEARKCKEIISTGTVSKVLVKIIDSMRGLGGFATGRVHYVPAGCIEQWKELTDALSAAGAGVFDNISVAMDGDTAALCHRRLCEEITAQVEAIFEDIARGTLNKEQLTSREREAHELLEKIGQYKGILQTNMEDLENSAKGAENAAAAVIMSRFAADEPQEVSTGLFAGLSD